MPDCEQRGIMPQAAGLPALAGCHYDHTGCTGAERTRGTSRRVRAACVVRADGVSGISQSPARTDFSPFMAKKWSIAALYASTFVRHVMRHPASVMEVRWARDSAMQAYTSGMSIRRVAGVRTRAFSIQRE